MKTTPNQSSELYKTKSNRYYGGARVDFIDILPQNPNAFLLEIGSGNGDTSEYALQQKKCGKCYGIELSESAAALAIGKKHDILIGDIENMVIDFPLDHFDVLIISEVLEHLRDPWSTLKRLKKHLKADAIIISGSPNVCHHSVLYNLLSGKWKYEPSGIFDETHLRWFSPSNYRDLFIDSGYEVIECGPAFPIEKKSKLANLLTLKKVEYLFHTQTRLIARPIHSES